MGVNLLMCIIDQISCFLSWMSKKAYLLEEKNKQIEVKVFFFFSFPVRVFVVTSNLICFKTMVSSLDAIQSLLDMDQLGSEK